MNAGEKKTRTMPKGGRKGGAVFPRVPLKDALGYAKKLVTKTHTSRIAKDVLYSGVLGAKSGTGNIRASAIKQYGFLVGDQKANFGASDLAKKISSAPLEELLPLYRQCALKPAIFRGLSETFHGDKVSKAKLKQRAAELNVHPEETDTCVDVYVSTMLTAELVTADGEQITHLIIPSAVQAAASSTENEEEGQDEQEDVETEDEASEEPDAEESVPTEPKGRGRAPKAAITVNVTLDSTTDSDKLAKQLALLKKYGAL